MTPLYGPHFPKSYLHEDGRWRHRFRSSAFTGFTHCPESFAAVHFDELQEDEQETDGTARGTAVHAGIEECLNIMSEGGTPKRSDIVEIVHTTLDSLWPWREVKAKRKTTARHANQMINTWFDEVRPHVPVPARQELAFKIPIVDDDERVITLTGHIDCIDAEGVCWDWKTAARPYEAWEYQRWASQPTAYSFAAWYLRYSHAVPDLAPQEMNDQWFRYAILLENGEKQMLDVVRNGGHVSWLIEQAKVIARLAEAGERPWPLNDAGWWCSPKWCPKFADCKGTHMSSDWMDVRK